jgi:hypothetical protein
MRAVFHASRITTQYVKDQDRQPVTPACRASFSEGGPHPATLPPTFESVKSKNLVTKIPHVAKRPPEIRALTEKM